MAKKEKIINLDRYRKISMDKNGLEERLKKISHEATRGDVDSV
tara:strand:+ start:251 stop:379 length:129 start_codon:yes stop_codon:yes gene_type:complete